MRKNASFLTLSRFCERASSFDFRRRISSFFDGRGFIVLLAGLTLVGHIFALDVLTMCLSFALAAASLWLASSLLPTVASAVMFIYQMSLEHAPSMPSFSDHYFTSHRLPLLIALAAVFFVSLICALLRMGIKTRDIASLPNIKGAAVLSAAFVLNGVMSGEWRWQSLAFGVVQILSFFVIGYVVLLGIRGAVLEHVLDYFTFLCAALAAVLVLQTLHLYLFCGVISDGEAQKGMVLYGWGIWTTAGMDMAVLIPPLFLGALRSRVPHFYLLLAHLTYLSSVLTLSRNALVFSTLALAVSAVLYIRRAKNARPLVCVYLSLGVLLLSGLPLYAERISRLFSDFFERGFSDNGRLELWSYGIECFLDAPLFGKGFFALNTDTFRAENIFPPMLHNTAVQLLASTGLFGFFAYIIYRVGMLRSLIRRRGDGDDFLLLSMLTLLMMSMLDNFLFHIQPLFLFSAEYAVLWLSGQSDT